MTTQRWVFGLGLAFGVAACAVTALSISGRRSETAPARATAEPTTPPAGNGNTQQPAPARRLEPLPGHPASAAQLQQALLDDSPVVVLADTDTSSMRFFDPETLVSTATVELPCAPTQLLVSEAQLLSLSTACNQLQKLELSASGARVVAAVDLPSEPVSMATTEHELLVVSDWGRTLSRLDRRTLKANGSVALQRSPRAIAISEDGATAYISHAVGSVLSEVDLSTSSVATHPLGASRAFATRRIVRKHMLPKQPDALGLDFGLDGRSSRIHHWRHVRRHVASVPMFATQGFSLALGDGKVFVPQALSSPEGGGSVATGYGISVDNFPPIVQDVAVFDPVTKTSNRHATFAIIRGWKAVDKNLCRLPRASLYDTKRGSLLVACVGSKRVLEFDGEARDPARTEWTSWPVPAGPSALALDADTRTLLVWSEFDRALSRLKLPSTEPPRVAEQSAAGLAARQAKTPQGQVLASVTVPFTQHDDALATDLRGRELFHRALDPAISKDGRACASCHPGGREDGLSWRAPGELRARQTMMLAGRLADTASYGWQGEHATLKEHVAHTVTHQLDGSGLSEAQQELLVAYLRRLPGPVRRESPKDPLVAQGDALFHAAEMGCADCHDADGTVDGDQHGLEAEAVRDTPSLRFVAGTAPFFHDGKYATLDDMLEHSQGSMGQNRALASDERVALVAYLRTL